MRLPFAHWHVRCSTSRRMNVGLYQAAAALSANSRWQEIIAENLAASSIPGYRKQELSFAAVQAGQAPPQAAPQAISAAWPRPEVSTNFQPGELKLTGVPTDIALEGRGFLEVQLPDGRIAYTRDGELKISPAGELVTKQGFAVLGESGPIQIDPDNPAPLAISNTGEMSQGTDIIGTLRAVEFDEPRRLTPLSRGYFLANHPSLVANPALTTHFHQGYLENANTSPTLEMAHLITAMRLYEANQRVIQTQDERMTRTIKELGSPS